MVVLARHVAVKHVHELAQRVQREERKGTFLAEVEGAENQSESDVVYDVGVVEKDRVHDVFELFVFFCVCVF